MSYYLNSLVILISAPKAFFNSCEYNNYINGYKIVSRLGSLRDNFELESLMTVTYNTFKSSHRNKYKLKVDPVIFTSEESSTPDQITIR